MAIIIQMRICPVIVKNLAGINFSEVKDMAVDFIFD